MERINERIKELALQANIKYSTRDDDFYSAAFDGVHRPDMEKFAELIVGQCLFEVLYEASKEPSVDIQNFSVTIADRIREHFGVKP